MAAKRRAYEVEGKSSAELMGMPLDVFQALDAKQLRAVVTRLASAANKRVRTLEKMGVATPAIALAKRQGGHFGTRGKESDLDALRKEFVRIRNFMSLPSSTKKGAEETIRKIQESLQKEGVDLDPQQTGEMWSTFDELKKRDPHLEDIKYNIVNEIAKRIEKGQSGKQLLKNMRSKINRMYKAEQQELKKHAGVSGYFDES